MDIGPEARAECHVAFDLPVIELLGKGLDLAREDAAVEQPDDIDLGCIADGLREPYLLAGEQVAVRGAAVELGNDMQVRQDALVGDAVDESVEPVVDTEVLLVDCVLREGSAGGAQRLACDGRDGHEAAHAAPCAACFKAAFG